MLHLSLLADKGTYQRVGEATELALRVLAEKIGLLGYAARALDTLSKTERATYCNDHWQHDYKKVIVSPLTLPPPFGKVISLADCTESCSL